MKQLLLFASAIALSFSAVAQSGAPTLSRFKDVSPVGMVKPFQSRTTPNVDIPRAIPTTPAPGNSNVVNQTSDNLVFLSPAGTYLSTSSSHFFNKNRIIFEPTTRSLVFTHRADPGVNAATINSGYWQIDASLDEGFSFSTVNHNGMWSTIPSQANGGTLTSRGGYYGSLGLMNPPGNTNADSVVALFSGSTFDGTLDGDGTAACTEWVWGGIPFGTAQLNLSGTAMSNFTRQEIASDVKGARGGHFWSEATHTVSNITYSAAEQQRPVDVNMPCANYGNTTDSLLYSDTLIIDKAVYNFATDSVALTETKISWPAFDGLTADLKIAASYQKPDTVWMSSLLSPTETGVQDSVFMPGVAVSYDGGVTWSSRTLIDFTALHRTNADVQAGLLDTLNFSDGSSQVFKVDSVITTEVDSSTTPVTVTVERSGGLAFCTSFDHDIIVDKNGDLHMIVGVGWAGNDGLPVQWSVRGAGGGYGIRHFHVYGNLTTGFKYQYLGTAETFRAVLTEPGGGTRGFDNRPAISVSPDGDVIVTSIFFTPLSAIPASATSADNNTPNMYMAAYDVDKDIHYGVDTIGPNSFAEGEFTFADVSPMLIDKPNGWTDFSVNPPVVKSFPNNAKGFEVPVMVSTIITDYLSPIQFNYVDDIYMVLNDTCNRLDSVTGPCPNFDDAASSLNDEIALNATIKLFPNPADREVTVAISSEIAQDLGITVVNSLGQTVVNEYAINAQSGLNESKIDLSNLSSGMYFVKVQSMKGGLESFPLIVE